MNDKQMPFSSDPRKIAENAVEQTRKTYEAMAETSEKAMGAIQAALPPGAQEFNKKVFSYAQSNIDEMFDLAQKMIQATSFDEVTKLQSQYLADQTRAFQQRAEDLSSSFRSAVAQNLEKDPKAKPNPSEK